GQLGGKILDRVEGAGGLALPGGFRTGGSAGLRLRLGGGWHAALDRLQGTGLIRFREHLRRGLRLPDYPAVAVEGGHRAVLLDAEDDVLVVNGTLASKAERDEPPHVALPSIGVGVQMMRAEVLT